MFCKADIGCRTGKGLALVLLFLLSAFFPVHGEYKGSKEVLPDISPKPELFILNVKTEAGFGNLAGDHYQFMGEKGQAYIKPGIELVKAIGPVFLMGQIFDTVGFTAPESTNVLDIKLTPLLFVPGLPLLVGLQLSGTFPFYEGRLIGDLAQIPKDFPVPSLAQVGMTPGVRYTQPFSWGALSGTFLFFANRLLDSDAWTLQGDFELSVNTNIGIGGYVSPLFTIRQMGAEPEVVYTSLEAQLSYLRFPAMGSLTVTMPGAQTDGFKKYGIIISPRFQYGFGSYIDAWAGIDFGNVGNGVGADVTIVPKIGINGLIPLMNFAPFAPAGTKAREAGDDTSAAPPRLYLGIAGAYANNHLYTSTAGRASTEYKNGHGFELALPLRYQIMPWFAMQTELLFIQKNYTLQRTGPYAENYSGVGNSFIELPLLANFSVGGDRLRAFVNVGGYAGIWIAGRRKGAIAENTEDPFTPGQVYYHDYDEDLEFDQVRDARFDAGLLAGLGVQYAFRGCTVFLEGRYYYGLTDLQQNYSYQMVPRMNDTFTIRLGVLFNRDILRFFRRNA